MSTHSYAILGTGAIGGFYGARLQLSGQQVHFLMRSDYEHTRKHGLVIDSVDGNFHLPKVNVYATVDSMPRCDVVVIALKSTQNHLLSDLLPAVLKEDSVVLILQNGLGNEAQVAPFLDPKQILGGLCFICSNKIGPGHIQHQGYGTITLGQYALDGAPGGISPQMQTLAEDLRRAGLPVVLTEDLTLARWRKLVWNIPFNGLSVLVNASTSQLMAHAEIRILIKELMQEVRQGAQACGRKIPESFIGEMMDHTAQLEGYLTSMKLDYDAGRPLEVEHIFGNPLRYGQQGGAVLPRIATLYRQLCFLNSRLHFKH